MSIIDQPAPGKPFGGLATFDTTNPAHVEAFMARVELAYEYPDVAGRPTGFAELDKCLQMLPGTLTVLAGEPGSGKSAQAVQWAVGWGSSGEVIYVLTEMTRMDMQYRMIGAVAHMAIHDVRNPRTRQHVAEIRKAAEWIRDHVSVHVIEAAGQPASFIVSEIKKYAEEHGLPRAIVVDNLNGVTAGSNVSGSASEGKITKWLSRLAKEEATGGVDCPVVLLHHLNREAAVAGRPTMRMLSNSSRIAEDADNILVISKAARVFAADDAFGPEPSTHKLWCIKNRMGPEFSIDLTFDGPTMRFIEAGPAKEYTAIEVADLEREAAYMERYRELPDF